MYFPLIDGFLRTSTLRWFCNSGKWTTIFRIRGVQKYFPVKDFNLFTWDLYYQEPYIIMIEHYIFTTDQIGLVFLQSTA